MTRFLAWDPTYTRLGQWATGELRGERHGPGPRQRAGELGEDRQVGMKPDPLFHSGATPVYSYLARQVFLPHAIMEGWSFGSS